jgi:hypothetical protein
VRVCEVWWGGVDDSCVGRGSSDLKATLFCQLLEPFLRKRSVDGQTREKLAACCERCLLTGAFVRKGRARVLARMFLVPGWLSATLILSTKATDGGVVGE